MTSVATGISHSFPHPALVVREKEGRNDEEKERLWKKVDPGAQLAALGCSRTASARKESV